MERTLTKIHTLIIKRSGEKQLFQIKLPKNAKRISGIQVTIQPVILIEGVQVKVKTDYLFPLKQNSLVVTKNKYFSVKSGDLRLQLNRKEDIFHAEDITLCELLPNYEALIGIKQIGFKNSFFSTIGTKLEKKTVELTSQDTIIGGSYIDTLFKELASPYQVKIYITYEVEE